MNKIKLFYSYSHKDEKFREELEKHLSILKDDSLIDEWYDRKIDAGDDWNQEIEKNISDSDIILLLFSPDFIASKSCKKEVKRTLELKREKNITFVPIIVRSCSWKDNVDIASKLALPTNGKPITQWEDQDEAWVNVYEGIKKKIEAIQKNKNPKIKNEFKKELIKNPVVGNSTLDKLFVYPDILEINTVLKQKLENNEIDSDKLKNLEEFKYKYILVEGAEQSGKTSLCNMLYLNYVHEYYYPILISGEDISGKANLKKIIENKYNKQYENTGDYWSIDEEKRILFVDDVNQWSANPKNFSEFISSIKDHFKYAIVFIDKLSNLSNKSAERIYFSYFQDFSIRSFGHKKRNEIVRKCISHDENIEFDFNNIEQLARLDKNTAHIETIIGANIVPSYPVFILTIFHTVETATQPDLSHTSYGHCYHAIITMNLGRLGIRAEDVDSYFNLLTELAYFMFDKKSKTVSKEELDLFISHYKEKFVLQKKSIQKLIQANIIREKNNLYTFQYVYIYYYFVARYISQKMKNPTIKEQITELLSDVHLKDAANIVIFITHHTKDKDLLDKIIFGVRSTFGKFPEATLSGEEKDFIKLLLDKPKLPDSNHDVKNERDVYLRKKDEIEPIADAIENDIENESDHVVIEIRRSAKSIEIIGQILKNQYGSLEKDKLKILFQEGQNVGLRLLKNFMIVMKDFEKEFEILTRLNVEVIANEKGENLPDSEIDEMSKKIIAQFSYSILFGWLNKIANALGYDKLIEIYDDVNNEIDTVSSKLINLSIHMWHTKNLDFLKIESLYNEFVKDKNHQAIYILKNIVSRHIYMHHVDYIDKQKIDSLLEFSLRDQHLVELRRK